MEEQKPKKPSRIFKIAGAFVPQIIATKPIIEGAEIIKDLWNQAARKNRKKSIYTAENPADFNALCKENEITEEIIEERKARSLLSKRLSWICMVFLLIWSVLGVVALSLQGFSWFAFELALMSALTSTVFFAYSFRYTLYYWQLERRKIAGVKEFIEDGGVMRTLKF